MLFRVYFRPPGVLTEERTVHKATGYCLAEHGRACKCPRVRGHVSEVWQPASSKSEAVLAVLHRYQLTAEALDHVEVGLPDPFGFRVVTIPGGREGDDPCRG